MSKPLSVGSEIRFNDQWWTVGMVGYVGERYYWLHRNNEVAMVPACDIEIPVISE